MPSLASTDIERSFTNGISRMKTTINYQRKEHAMVGKAFTVAVIIGLLPVSFPRLCAAGDSPPDIIRFNGTTGRPMEAPGVYPRLYSGAVEFHHEEHFSSYGPICSDCHHADSEELSADLSPDIDVLNCDECHDQEGLVYGRQADAMSDDELIFYRANVLHKLCIGCHESSSAEARALIAPLACRGCHAQRSRDYIRR